jgi:hypothetical protein
VAGHKPVCAVDAWTKIELTGDWEGTAAGICNGVFHFGTAPATGNLHCTLTFSGTVLGRAGTIRQTVNGTFNDPTWTGQIALAQGTGELSGLAANDLTYTQTGLFGTVAGTVVFPHG